MGAGPCWGRIWRPGRARALGVHQQTQLLGQKQEFLGRALVAGTGGGHWWRATVGEDGHFQGWHEWKGDEDGPEFELERNLGVPCHRVG